MLETKSYSMHSKFYELIEDLLGRRLALSDRQMDPDGLLGQASEVRTRAEFVFFVCHGTNNFAPS